MHMHWSLVIVLLSLGCAPDVESIPQRQDQRPASYDAHCDSIRVPAFDKRSATKAPLGGYEPIPRIIHQIWLGPREGRFNDTLASSVEAWDDFARAFGYEHHLWSAEDIENLAPYMHPRNLALIHRFIDSRAYHAAADTLRLELIHIFGGVYVDCDFMPPTIEGSIGQPRTVSTNAWHCVCRRTRRAQYRQERHVRYEWIFYGESWTPPNSPPCNSPC